MDDTFLSSDWAYQIKAATRDLVRDAGGLERAGKVAGRGKSSVERWCSPNYDDIIPIECVLRLERETGTAYVTAAMADYNKRGLADRVTAPVSNTVLEAMAHASNKAADMISATAAAVADGVITPNEARGIERVSAEAGEAFTDLRNAVSATGNQPLRVVP